MGLGDEIMAAGVAERMWRETRQTVAIMDLAGRPRDHPVWEGNPAIDPAGPLTLVDCPGQRGYMLRWDGARSVFDMTYRNMDHPGRIYVPAWARAWARDNVPPRCIIVEPIVRRPSSMGKDWGFERWRAVTARLTGRPIVQLGEDGGRAMLPGATWIKTPTIWHAAAAIEQSSLVLTPEGGTHHMAGALRRPAVVIYGGFTHPQLTGYDWHENLYVDAPGSPCGNFDTCAHCVDALAAITPDMVIDAIKKLGLDGLGRRAYI
jgi:hypothetical protein